MTDEFTKTELLIISLVMGQQADEYPQKRLRMHQLSTKARKLADDRQSDQ